MCVLFERYAQPFRLPTYVVGLANSVFPRVVRVEGLLRGGLECSPLL